MNLQGIQQALRDDGLDGWLFCDFHHRDLMAYKILGLDQSNMTTRRWFYFVPHEGEPIKLSHRVEPRKLEDLPGRQEYYLAWGELHQQLKSMVAGASRVAMQYSPMNDIPYISVVDAGTVELVRSMGVEVVSSADLVQQFESVTDAAGLDSHRLAGDLVLQTKDAAYALMGEALRQGRAINEFEVMQFILARFEEHGLTTDGDVPIVGFNEHAADPHYEPTQDKALTLSPGDTILVDLWARRKKPTGVYYDVTWCGFAGNEPPEEYARIFGIACRARDAAVQLIRERVDAGQPIHGYEVDRACRKVVEDAGYGDYFVHRTGHNIGNRVHGNGVNIDDLETKDTRQLVPGVCCSIEPGIYLEGKMGVRTEINVFITPDRKVGVHGAVQQDLILLG